MYLTYIIVPNGIRVCRSIQREKEIPLRPAFTPKVTNLSPKKFHQERDLYIRKFGHGFEKEEGLTLPSLYGEL